MRRKVVKALPNHVVLAQVQMSRVLGVKTVIAVIELDDKSPESERRIESDAKKGKATTDAGLRLVRWHVKSLPDVLTIQREISTMMRRWV